MNTKAMLITLSLMVFMGACGTDLTNGCGNNSGRSSTSCQRINGTTNSHQSSQSDSEKEKNSSNKEREIAQLKELLKKLETAAGNQDSAQLKELKSKISNLEATKPQSSSDVAENSAENPKKKNKNNKKNRGKNKDTDKGTVANSNPLEKIGTDILSSAGDTLGKVISGGIDKIFGGGEKSEDDKKPSEKENSDSTTQTTAYTLPGDLGVDKDIAWNSENDFLSKR